MQTNSPVNDVLSSVMPVTKIVNSFTEDYRKRDWLLLIFFAQV